ncbi:GDP-mannose mannosyl hydrolase [Salinicola halophyticus]|uniref:GDP-mannose mannosyl hydrolase n=1 Tax=Salinicola halophyticus TaxID=1808881 RepID=UPI003F47F044
MSIREEQSCRGFLPDDDFRKVIKSAPLVSIDLVIYHRQGVLLGKRINRPAKDFWFVPGGRIRKNECFDSAFSRLCLSEVGVTASVSQAKFLGAFEHFYQDNVFGEDVSTHYIALGYRLGLCENPIHLPECQHSEFQWWSPTEAMASDYVHSYTKNYLEMQLLQSRSVT